MGNTSKKLAEKCTILTKDEQKMLAVTFRPVSRNSPRVREDDLVVSGTLDALLLEVCIFSLSSCLMWFYLAVWLFSVLQLEYL